MYYVGKGVIGLGKEVRLITISAREKNELDLKTNSLRDRLSDTGA